MNPISRSACFGAAFGALAVACGGPTVGDGVKEVVFSVVATASAPDVAALGEGQGGLGVSRAFVSVSGLDLIPCSAGASDIALGARGYDLLTSPPPSEAIETAVTMYCGLRVDIAPASRNATSDIPKGTSLYVEGQDVDGNAFALSSQSSSSLSFAPAEGSSFGDQPFLLGFDLSVWLAGLPLPADMADTSAMLFDSQVVDSATLYVDANGNGAVDANEQTPIAEATLSR